MSEQQDRPKNYSHARAQVHAELLLRSATEGLKPHPRVKKGVWPPNYDHIHAWRRQQLAMFELDPRKLVAAHAWYAGQDLRKKGVRDSYAYAARAIAFINHWCDVYEPRHANIPGKLSFMPFVLFERQEEMVQFMQVCLDEGVRGLIEKSRTMGATWVAGAFSVYLWRYAPATLIGWGSNSLEDVDTLGVPDSVLEKMRIMIRRLPAVFQPAGFNPDLHLIHKRLTNPQTGSVIRGDGGPNIGRGGRSRIYFVDEAAHLSRPEEVEASLSENTHVRIDISTVSGLGTVFHRLREAGVEWSPGQKVVRNRTNVFVLDWTDHPEKTEEWFSERKELFSSAGMAHVVARELERNYAGSQEGTIIQPDWVRAAVDAHIKLSNYGFDDSGPWRAGLDIADGGQDLNALIKAKGNVVRHGQEWKARDTAVTARHAVGNCLETLPLNLQYDHGFGSGVKAAVNDARDANPEIFEQLDVAPWNAAAVVQQPFERLIPGDDRTPRHRDYFANAKAQAWWRVARMFEYTFNILQQLKEGTLAEDGIEFPDQLISLDSKALGPVLNKLMKELCQATAVRNRQMKLVVDKAPDGVRSPNLADALIMAFNPQESKKIAASFTGPVIVRVS